MGGLTAKEIGVDMSLDVCQKEPGCSNNYVDKYELGGKGEVSGKIATLFELPC